MDSQLQRAYRNYLKDPSELHRLKLQGLAERSGLLGPIMADACALAVRIHHAVVNRQDLVGYYQNNYRFIELLRSATWQTRTEDFITRLQEIDGVAVGRSYFRALETYLIDRESYKQPAYKKYLDLLLPLWLFLFTQFSHRSYPFVVHDGKPGIQIDTDTLPEFVKRLRSQLSHRRGEELESICAAINRGHVELWGYDDEHIEYTNIIELLPEELSHKLQEDWEKVWRRTHEGESPTPSPYSSSKWVQSFGGYLKRKYRPWLGNAILDGWEAGTWGELFQDFKRFVDRLTWASGAEARMIDSETIEIWITLEKLKGAALLGIPLEELTEQDIDIGGFHFRDDHGEFSKEIAMDRLFDKDVMPKKFWKYIPKD